MKNKFKNRLTNAILCSIIQEIKERKEVLDMCVIAYLPKEARSLSKEELMAMWDKNPHGAGIMWLDDTSKVKFSKGYMDFNSFYRDYLIVKEDYNYECAVHFRIATSGGINQQMCHPFVMTGDEELIKKINGKSDVCVMHNGIIDIDNRPTLNDTCEYIIRILYPEYEEDNRFFLHLTQRREMLIQNDIGYSKLLFFSKEGVKMIGDWKFKNGVYFSNLYWDTYKPTYKYFRNNYNDDYENFYPFR